MARIKSKAKSKKTTKRATKRPAAKRAVSKRTVAKRGTTKRAATKRREPEPNIIEYRIQEIPDIDVTYLRSEDERYYHNPDRSRSPEITGGDLDADWQRPDVGEEAVSGSVPTPDQDVVEEVGEAVGLTYEDEEPLDPEKKIAKRDENRWELNPASSEDYKERTQRLKRTKR